MDLRSGLPFWPAHDAPAPAYPPLQGDARCDVAIVGAGITGALLADALSAAGLSLIMLDRREPARGSTAASTAIIQYELDLPVRKLPEHVGQDAARRMYLASARAVEELERIAASLPGCAAEPRESLYLGRRRSDASDLRQETEARLSMGMSVSFLPRDHLRRDYNLKGAGAILSRTAAAVDPWRLTHALLAAATARGARVHGTTKVTSLEGAGPIRLRTEHGATISADRVVLAAGYETEATLRDWSLALPQRLARLKSTYALATAPIPHIPAWCRRTVFWETARPYFYLRSAPGNRLMIGGLDEPFRNPDLRDALIPRKTRKLLRRLHQLVPGIRAEPEHAWAGAFGESQDSAGYIDHHPACPHLMFVAGYGGNGMVLSVLARDIVLGWCRATPHPEAGLWSLNRGGSTHEPRLMRSRSKTVNSPAPPRRDRAPAREWLSPPAGPRPGRT